MPAVDDSTGGSGDGARGENVKKVRLATKYDIPIEKLSYEHIGECNNAREMEHIVKILRSGEEGTFPHLIEFAENKLRELNPKCKILRKEEPALVPAGLARDEWAGMNKDLLNWSEEVKVMDVNLANNAMSCLEIYDDQDPVRTIKEIKKIELAKKAKIEDVSKTPKSVVPRSYSDWDKFDADEELLKLDTLEERKKEEREVKKKLEEMETSERMKQRHKSGKDKLKTEEKQKSTKDADEKSNPKGKNESAATKEKQPTACNPEIDAIVNTKYADLERIKGNEFFKQGDYETAVSHFMLSISLSPTVHAYNNLALALFKLSNFEDSIEACDGALALEPDNTKALFRRGASHLRLQQSGQAVQDFQRVGKLEPGNKEAAKLLASARESERQAKDKPRRMKIVDQKHVSDATTAPRPRRQMVPDWQQPSTSGMSNRQKTAGDRDFGRLRTNPDWQRASTSGTARRPKIVELSSTEFSDDSENETYYNAALAGRQACRIVELE